MTTEQRIQRLEEMASKRSAGSVLITFADGKNRRMQAADVIPLLCSQDFENIVDISGDGGHGSGHLVELLAGLVEENKNEGQGPERIIGND